MKNQFIYLRIIALFITTLFIINGIQAQTGSISGRIQTDEGVALAGISIELEGAGIGTAADEQGNFQLSNVPVGKYNLTAKGIGYTATKQNITVVANQTTELNLQLSIATQTLQEVVVAAQGNGYKTNGISASLRLNTPPLETPQNIIGVSSATLRDQQGFTLNDVARNVSGVNITSQHSALAPSFRIRGTASSNNAFRNGVRNITSFNQIEDLAIIDRVEFVKGAGSFLISSGETGGSYNVVTKPADGRRVREANFSFGSYNLLRGAVDLGGRIGNGLNFRLNAAAQNQDAMMDYVSFERYTVAPILQYNFDEKTSLTAEYNYGYTKVLTTTDLSVSSVNGKTFALPDNFTYQDPNLPPGEIIDHYGRVALTHQISTNWQLQAQLAYRDYLDAETWFLDADGGTPVVDENGLLKRHVNYYLLNSTGKYGQAFLSGKFNTGSVVNHSVLIGYDGADISSEDTYLVTENEFVLDTKNPVYGIPSDSLLQFDIPSDPDLAGNSWSAVFVQDQIKFFDKLILSVAGRFTHFENTRGTTIDELDVFSPRAGLLYLVNNQFSIYGLYDQSFIPQPGRSFEGDAFEPVRGGTLEFGLKKEWYDGRLTTSLAAYNTIKRNSLVPDPIRPRFSITTGEIEIQGLELDIIGDLTPNLSVVVNYAYTDAKITKDSREARVGVRPRGVAEHLANAWLKYAFREGGLRGLGLAVGATYMGDRSASNTAKLNIKGYTKLDASIFYNFEKLSFAFNLDNLTNEQYFAMGNRLNATDTVYVPGLPLNFRMTVGTRF